VAHAKELGVTRVVYGGKAWNRDRPRDSWRPVADRTAENAPVGRVRIEVGRQA
jgi:hypothetical protein